MESDKEAKFMAVVDETLRLISVVGLDGMSISRIARNSKVSRAWIYKYIGSDNEEVLKVSLKIFAENYSSLAELTEHTQKDELFNSLYIYSIKMFELIKISPHAMNLYYSNISQDNIITDTIKDLENKYLGLLTTNFKNCFDLSLDQAKIKSEAFHYMRMGSVLNYLLKFQSSENLGWENSFISEFKMNLQNLFK